MSSDRVTAAVAEIRAAVTELTTLDVDQFTHHELVELLGELETVTWRLPTVGHRVIARLHREASPTELGAKSLGTVLTQRLRIIACRSSVVRSPSMGYTTFLAPPDVVGPAPPRLKPISRAA